MMKYIVCLFLTFPLIGCVSPMKPQQYEMAAQDLTLLHLCMEKGWIHPNLASEGMALYQDYMSNYSIDDIIMEQHLNSEYLKYENNMTPQICYQYSVRLQKDIIQKYQTMQSLQQFSQSLNNISQTLNNSTQMYNQMNQSFQNNMLPVQPIKGFLPEVQHTHCFDTGSGIMSCTTE